MYKKIHGGYDVPLAGRPAGEVAPLPPAGELHLPLTSRRLAFTEIRVETGQSVAAGTMLARDAKHNWIPLLAPRGGMVHLDDDRKVIRLTDLADNGYADLPDEPVPGHAARRLGSAAQRRHKLLHLGAWQFFTDAFTGEVANPFSVPQAVLVSTACLEPFQARGDVQLHEHLESFERGLEHLQNLLEYQPIHLIVPDVQTDLAEKVRESVRGHARVKVLAIPLQYPCDSFGVIARRLGLSRRGEMPTPTGPDWHEGPGPDGELLGTEEYHPVWALHVEGVCAIQQALGRSQPVTDRILAVGGPGVGKPTHFHAPTGYPIAKILEATEAEENVRVIDGGALRGRAVGPEQTGLSAECTSLTVLSETVERKLLGWAMPGWDTQSAGRCYLSKLRAPFQERLTVAVRGERRACVACGMCEQVCPVQLWPHLIHKALYQEDIERAEATGVEICVDCGLCSYVCPSKIELADQFREARRLLAEERETARIARQREEARARREAERRAQEAEQASGSDESAPPADQADGEEGGGS